jgi:hypothetical protein
MPYSFNPFSGNFDNTPSTLKGDNAYSNLLSNSATWVDAYDTGTTYKANSASYATINFANNKFFPLSGGLVTGNARINGNVTIFGDLSSTGTQTFANTIFATTSSLSVVHVGSGPAVWIGNNGSGDIASFNDIDQGIEILHVGGINSTFPNVGIKVSNPNKDFTVNGEISANNTIWDANGNSNQWNSVYSGVQSNSATWLTVSYIQKFDYVTDGIDYSYSGIAVEGTLETDPFWKITRLSFSDVGTLSTTGVAQSATWTERLTATYI